MTTTHECTGFSLLVIGSGIGWMVGLSESPIVVSVVASILAIATTIVAGINSTDRATNTNPHVASAAAAVLIFGIAAAATLGMYARTHDWFGGTRPGPNGTIVPIPGVLKSSVPASEYQEFATAEPAALFGHLKASSKLSIQRFAEDCGDNYECLKAAVDHLIQPD